MRKMKTPEMDVIRFNESDVIVASGDPVPANTLRLTGFNSGSVVGKFQVGDNSYTTNSDVSGLYDDLSTLAGTTVNGDTCVSNGHYYMFSSLIRDDQGGMDLDGYDGDYTWSGWYFKKNQ